MSWNEISLQYHYIFHQIIILKDQIMQIYQA